LRVSRLASLPYLLYKHTASNIKKRERLLSKFFKMFSMHFNKIKKKVMGKSLEAP
jgi:hypothetical protein